MGDSSWIKNFSLLARSDLRRDALVLTEVALNAVETKTAIKKQVKLTAGQLNLGNQVYNLNNINRVFLCGVGKCALTAACEVENILGEKITGGVVIGVEQDNSEHYFNYFKGTHPLPSEENVKATRHLIHLLKEVRSDDLIIFIVSGGGSTLLCAPPRNSFSFSDEQKIFTALTAQGATIQELNTVRKHLSLARGGWLAQYAYPAQIATLIFSDVPGDNFGFVSSGPFIYDETDVYKADFILDKYQIRKKIPIALDQLIETPKDKKYFWRVKNIPIVVNTSALKAAAIKAKELGYQPIICDNKLTGEAKTAGQVIAKILSQAPKQTALFYGGETVVNLKDNPHSLKHHQGGRNRELALSSLISLPLETVLVSLASDGQDNGPVAGALIDQETIDRAEVMGLDREKYLANHNSSEFFQLVGDEIKTGQTGINVADLVIALKK